jgi:hypothetical protein
MTCPRRGRAALGTMVHRLYRSRSAWMAERKWKAFMYFRVLPGVWGEVRIETNVT